MIRVLVRSICGVVMLAAGLSWATVLLGEEDSGAKPLESEEVSLGAAVFQVVFSPDGKTLAAAGEGRVGMWHLADKNRRQILAAGDRFTSLAFSLDGASLAAGEHCSPDGVDRLHTGRVQLREVATGKLLWERRVKRAVSSVAFSPDGKTLAYALEGDIVFWDLQRQRDRLRAEHPGNLSIRFAPSGQTLASACDTPEPSFSPMLGADGNPIAPAGRGKAEDGSIRLWNPTTGQIVRTLFDKSSEGVNSIAFSPDDGVLAAGYHDAKIRIWDAAGGKLLHTLPGSSDRSWMLPVAFSPDGKQLASGSYNDEFLCLWDVQSGKRLSSFRAGRITTLSFSADGRIVATSDGNDRNGTVRLWKLTSVRKQ
jgi:WD40 repeat protein